MRRKKVTGTELLAVLLISLVLSNGTLFGMFSPFAVAFLSALSGINVAVSLLGTIVGFYAFGKFMVSLHYFAAILFLSALQLFSESFRLRITPMRKALYTAAIVLISDVLTSTWIRADIKGIVLIFADAVICGFLSYSANYLMKKSKRRDWLRPETKQMIFICIAFTAVISALSSFDLWFFNIGRIAGMVALLIFARRSMSESIVCGALTIAGIAAGNLDYAYSTALIVFSAIIISLFQSYGNSAQLLAFVTVTITEMFILGIDVYSSGLVIDGFAAALISAFIKYQPDILNTDKVAVSDYASQKLLVAADAVGEVRSSIDKVAEMLDRKSVKNLDWIYEKASGVVCRTCEKNMTCWQENFGNTAGAMSQAVKEYDKKTSLTAEDLPEYLRGNCKHCVEFADELNGFYNSYLSDTRATRKLLSQRKLMLNQLDLAREMFVKVSEDLHDADEQKKLIFRPEVKAMVLPAGGRVSGDTANAFCDDDGNFYFCLFDGMGKGKRAAVDSSFLSNIVGGLAGTGIAMETVMKTANDCMLVKSSDESFSTADVIKINLKNGNTEIIKAGSAPTYYLSGGKVTKIGTQTFPLGVFTNTKSEKTILNASAEDVFVIASDGAGDVTRLLEKSDTENTDALATRLLEFAKNNNAAYADDISIAVIKLKKTI